MNNIIEVENLSKVYVLGEYTGKRFFGDIKQIFSNTPIYQKKGGEYLWALDDVSFTIKQGDIVGLIGKNGAGKSTLLKILSRITTPSHGQATIYGRVGSLLELGAGFHPALTGLENIYLSGAVLGMHRSEIKKNLDEIIDFSGLAKHINTPIRRYSSGMKIKLGFAISAFLDADILLYDEVLAVADQEFRHKALNKIIHLVSNKGKTSIFVSHNNDQLRALCNKGIVLDAGKVVFSGDFEDAVKYYSQSLLSSDTSYELQWEENNCPNLEGIHLLYAKVNANAEGLVEYNQTINMEFELKLSVFVAMLSFEIVISDEEGGIVIHTALNETHKFESLNSGNYHLSMQLPEKILNPGKYIVSMTLKQQKDYRNLERAVAKHLSFTIHSDTLVMGAQSSHWKSKLGPEIVKQSFSQY